MFLQGNAPSLAAPPGINLCLIGINRSPCTSAGLGGYVTTSGKTTGLPGCAERLEDLVANGLTIGGVTYRFKLIVSVRNLYGGNSDAEASSSYAMEHYAAQHGDQLQFEFQRTATGARFSGTAAATKKSRKDF